MPQLGVIFVQYDQARYVHSFSMLLEVLKPLGDWKVWIVKVDNKREDQNINILDETIIEISGDNSLFEFSGWMKGWQYLTDHQGECDGYLFVTDAFLAYRDRYHALVDSEVLHFLVRESAVTGLIDLPPAQFKNLKLFWKIFKVKKCAKVLNK